MTEYVLYQFPLRACSSVTVNAMLEVGLEFEDRVVNILSGEQNEPAYKKIHPYGKVPALLVDGVPIIENVAILLYMDAIRPGILFPPAASPLERAVFHADLVWCTATMHPAIRQVRMPLRYTDGETAGVRERGLQETTHILNVVEQRLAGNNWWYGDNWSILDVYVNWGIMTAASTDLLSIQSYPAIMSHHRRVHERPTFQAALTRQTETKDRAGLVFPDEASWNMNITGNE